MNNYLLNTICKKIRYVNLDDVYLSNIINSLLKV